MTVIMAIKVGNPNKTEEEIVKEDMDEIDRQLGTVSFDHRTISGRFDGQTLTWSFRMDLILSNPLWNGASNLDE